MGKSTISTGPWLQVRKLLVITRGYIPTKVCNPIMGWMTPSFVHLSTCQKTMAHTHIYIYNVNPGLINMFLLIRGYSPYFVMIWYLNGTLPIKQPRGLLIQGWHYIYMATMSKRRGNGSRYVKMLLSAKSDTLLGEFLDPINRGT